MRRKYLFKRNNKLLLLTYVILIFTLISTIFIPNIVNIYDKHKKFEEPKEEKTFIIQPSSSNPPNKLYFKYYKVITINQSYIFSTYINFPVLISILDSDLHNHVIQSNGNDIAFANDTDWLDHEIELFNKSYDDTYAQLIAWVRIPRLSNTSLTVYMYYGNATMSSRQNPTGVWDSFYKGVWHLSELSGSALDSTSYGTSGGVSGTVTRGSTGKADGAYDFGSNGQINFGDPSDDHLDFGTSSFTISFWINFDDATGNYQIPLYKGATTSFEDGYDFETNWAGESLTFRICEGANLAESPPIDFDYDNWMYITGVVDRTSNRIRIFKDGLQVGSGNSIATVGNIDSDKELFVSFADANMEIDGLMDEIRLCNVPRSAGWIASEYLNQNDPNSFYTVSAEFALDPIPPNVTINSPNQNDLFGDIAPNFNVTVNDNGLIDKMWYRLSNGTITTINTTFTGNESISQTRWNEMGNGTVTIQFFANDSCGNEGFSEVIVRKDINFPVIVINSPNDFDLFGATAPDYNVEIFDPNGVDYMWYTLNNGLETYFTENGTISQSAWNFCGNGTVSIKLYANDSLGNEGFSEVIVRKEIESPNITIKSPVASDLFGSTPPSFNVEISDNNGVDTMWYTLNNGLVTYFTENGTISQSAWSLCVNGTVSIKFYANNTLGNIDFSEVIVRKDVINPVIIINTPDPNDLFGSTPPLFNVIITDPNGIDTKWYTIDGGIMNTTFISNGMINPGLWAAQGNGTVTIGFYANDSLGNEGYSEVIVRKDIEPPSIQINSPYPNEVFGAIAPSFNVEIVDSSGINTRWYTIDGGILNITFSINTTINQDLWSLEENGTVTIKFYATDSLGNEGFSEVIVRKDIDPPSIQINSPIDYDLFNETAPSFNVEINSINGIDAMWYSLDGGLTNTFFTTNESINQAIWDTFGDENITIRFYANNSLGIIGFSEVSIIKDIYAPMITINTPNNNSYCNKAPIINIEADDINLDKLWCKIGSYNILVINGGDFQLNTSIWNSLSQGPFQIFIYANDTSGHLNDTIILNLCKDTINPNAPIISDPPTGEISLPIIFDWEEVIDDSGIGYYRLIIDTEANPFTTPGFLFEINISSTSSYYEFLEYLVPRDYYFFIYAIDGAGNQGTPASGTFTIKSTSASPAEFPLWIIAVVILISVAGSITAITIVRKKSHKKMGPPRKKLPLKPILTHIAKISSQESTSEEVEVGEILIQDGQNQYYNEVLPDEADVGISIDEIKALGEELFSEGAYLEAIKQFQNAEKFLSTKGRNEEAALFSDLITGIEGLVEEREKRLELLEREKNEGDTVKIFELYHDIIEISRKLRDLDAIDMFESELIQFFQINKFKLVVIEKYRSNLEKEADSFSNNGFYEKAAQTYEKCEEISEFLVKLEKEEERINIEKFRNKKNENLEKIS